MTTSQATASQMTSGQTTSDTTDEHATDDYVAQLHVTATTAQVIAALTDPDQVVAWWTSFTTAERDGNEIRLSRDRSTAILVLHLQRPSAHEVEWAVTSCDFLADWVGTTPTFTVLEADDGSSNVTFHHVGLGPALECFEQCRAGWDHFLPSLRRYLDTGVGLADHPRSA
jgi:uncharacterized protein YndB with AHSA1/START domain